MGGQVPLTDSATSKLDPAQLPQYLQDELLDPETDLVSLFETSLT